MEESLPLLVDLAKLGCLNGFCRITTFNLAKRFSFSQQTGSRKLRQLENEGLIERRINRDGINVRITDKGREMLSDCYYSLKKIIEHKVQKRLKGTLFTGLGEGKYYISLDKYQEEFKEKLGFNTYYGTLNLKVDEKTAQEFLLSCEEILISGFKTRERTYGRIICYKVKVNGRIPGAIVVPERTTYSRSVIEIISKYNLRKKLGLKDRDTVEVEAEKS